MSVGNNPALASMKMRFSKSIVPNVVNEALPKQNGELEVSYFDEVDLDEQEDVFRNLSAKND